MKLDPNTIQTVGGGFGILAFLAVFVKTLIQDKIWRDLLKAVREDLASCRERSGELESKVQHLEGEVIGLRRELHLDQWMGIEERRPPIIKAKEGEHN